MERRGQVTIFIIVGIVVVAILGFLLVTRSGFLDTTLSDEESDQFVSLQVDPVQQHVISCVREELVKGVHLISVQGGYLDPLHFEELGGRNVGYACIDGVNEFTGVTIMANELRQYFDLPETKEELENCIDDFQNFESSGLNIDHDFQNLNVFSPQITSGRISQELSYPITLKRQDSTANVDQMRFSIDSNLYEMYMLASRIVKEECTGSDFSPADYFWFTGRQEVVPGSIGTGLKYGYGQAWYLTSFSPEEDGRNLRFHFIVG